MTHPEATHGAGDRSPAYEPGRLRLALGALLPPLAFLANLQLMYVAVTRACGTGARWTMHLVPLSTLLVSLVAGALAWREWHRTGAEWPDEDARIVSRSRFVAFVALLQSAFFVLLILGQWATLWLGVPCRQG